MKEISVRIKTKYKNGKEYISCICPCSEPHCDRDCEVQKVSYDEYQDLMECYKNKGRIDEC